MKGEISTILLDLKTYLNYQRSIGNDYLPKGGSPMPPADTGPKATTDKQALLGLLREEIGNCTRCKLHKGRTNLVFGVGSPNADLMFVGEGPGYDEDRQGIPFVGRAGQLLTKIIAAMGLKREDTYIANVVKCRPPENRNPEVDEIGACEPFLVRQIEIIEPKIIVCLGTFAAQTLLKTEEKITRLRGKIFDYHGVKLVPTYHPAFLLRNPNMKRPVWEDMQLVMRELGLTSSRP